MKLNKGLTSSEAEQLLLKHGANEIVGKARQTAFAILISQFTSFLVILLILAAVASLFLGDILDGFFILLIVLVNGVFGFIQEYKAEKTIAALKKLTVITVRVIRDGEEKRIDSKQLVPGDIVLLSEGDKIPADCDILESLHLEVNESALTGESMPIEKSSDSSDGDKVYLGTIVIKGRAKVLVVKTGMQTKFGNIASSLSDIKDEETVLQKKLNILGKQLGALSIFASIVVFVVGYFLDHKFIDMLLTSISLAVAAVPEGLPAVITITLAVGMQHMAKQKAILRKLSSVESLGGATVIATDKTGTLTRNQMHVVKVWVDNSIYKVDDRNLKNSFSFKKLLDIGVICNNANLVYKHDHGSFDVLGDSTEGALLMLAAKNEVSINKVKELNQIEEEYAFDASLKIMTVVVKNNDQNIVYTKGAPETIINKCSHILVNGKKIKLDSKSKESVTRSFEDLAKLGLRIIALAIKDFKGVLPKNRTNLETDLVFVGLVGIEDPPRPEVKDAINMAANAGIRTIMVTGDNELTADAIGTQIGLIKEGEEIITGKQFQSMSDAEAIAKLPNIRIFARTTPDQKLRIVQLLQKMGNVVAVTGDGVNDSLALKQSDVGVAMGITGTDVAKEASDMILTDDNYATLVKAVEEGRTIFDNIKSSIKYLVGCNVGEVVAVIIGILLGWPLILTPLQLLYINLVTDGLPAIALAVAAKDEGVMSKKPRTSKNIFGKTDGFWFFEVSILTAVVTLFSFWLGYKTGDIEFARSFSFNAIIFVQHFILLDVGYRNKSVFSKNIFKDKLFLIAFFLPLVVQMFIISNPFVASIFKISTTSSVNVITVVGLSALVLVFSEVRKFLQNKAQILS